MQKLKIDLNKFNGAKPFTAKDGTEYIAIPIAANNVYVGKKGAYLELALIENKDGEDQFGNAGFASVDVGKQRREAGEKGPIIGNWKHIETSQAGRDRTPQDAYKTKPEPAKNDSSWIDDETPPF